MPTLTTPIANGRTAEIFAWEDGQVLKLYRCGFNQEDADREARVGRMVYAAGVPTPAVLDVIDVDGRRGIIYERIDGPSMLELLSQCPLGAWHAARQLADLQLGMHALAAPQLPRFRDKLEYAIQQANALPAQLREPGLRALAKLPDGESLCHGDFHPGNVIVTARGPVLIDWMTACTGNPWADVARTQLLLTLGDIPEDVQLPLRVLLKLVRQSFFQTYLKHYLAHRPDPDQQIRAWLPILAAARFSENIPSEHAALLKVIQAGLHL